MHDCAEDNTRDNYHKIDTGDPLAATTMSGPIRKVFTCQWIKTEPFEENETSDVFNQFQSEPVDKSERKGDIKHESLTNVGLSCEQMNSGTTGNIEQSQFTSSKVKLEPFTDSESNSSRDAVPVYFSDREIKVEFEDGSEIDPNQASTSFPVNIWRPHNNYLQTEEATDSNVTVTGDAVRSESISVTSMDKDEAKSSGDEQKSDAPCLTEEDPGSNQPETSVKTAPRPFVCDVCNKSFTKKSYLKTHKLIHTGEKPFVCDVCNKSFTQKSQLKTHGLIHTGEKSFVCDVCQMRFTQKIHLKTHKLIHTGQKQFVCDVCEKGFVEKGSLMTHMLMHSENKSFVCDVCNTSFTDKGYLKRHKLFHTGQKQFVCDVCNKAFTQKCDLKRHKLIHTGQKPFVCAVCEKSFTLKGHLKKHQLTHIGQKPFCV